MTTPKPARTLLIVATGNAHKITEIGAILGQTVSVVGMRELGEVPDLIETGNTFEANATMKAEQLATWLSRDPVLKLKLADYEVVKILADDSGLEVDALDGAPGVYSARFATADGEEGNASDEANNAKLLRLLVDTPDDQRSARFRCVLALLSWPQSPSNPVHLFSGACEGRMGRTLEGDSGFGYDPLFYPLGHDQSFAQLGSNIKNQLSHRAHALKQLARHLETSA